MSASSGAFATFRQQLPRVRLSSGLETGRVKITGTLHFSPMLYLSSQPVKHPCNSQQSSTVCGWPLDRLRPGGTLIAWENRGFPDWSLRTTQGSSLRIGGRQANGDAAGHMPPESAPTRRSPSKSSGRFRTTGPLSPPVSKAPGLASAVHEVDALLASKKFLAP